MWLSAEIPVFGHGKKEDVFHSSAFFIPVRRNKKQPFGLKNKGEEPESQRFLSRKVNESLGTGKSKAEELIVPLYVYV